MVAITARSFDPRLKCSRDTSDNANIGVIALIAKVLSGSGRRSNGLFIDRNSPLISGPCESRRRGGWSHR
jgi:hypothetical protein